MKILFFLLIFFTFSFSQNLEKVTLQLQWKHQFEFAGFYAAKEKGFYAQAGLDVEFKEFEKGMNLTEEILKGNADYATSYSSIILDYLNKKPIVFIANFFKQSPLVLVTQQNIKTPKELKGKKIMGIIDSTHNKTLLAMLQKFDITPNDFTNIPKNFAIDSFINKEVDAISVFTTNEIYRLNQLGIKYNILDPAVFGIKLYDINLFTSLKELKNHPQRVEAFKRASIQGWEYALKNKEELIDIILKKYNTQNKSKEALFFEAKQCEYLMLNNVYPVGSIDIRQVRTIADGYKQSEPTQALINDELHKFIYKPQTDFLQLTNKQKEYLKNKKQIKMCVDPNWMPLEKIENGNYTGIASDHIKLISKKIQTPFTLVETVNWTQSLQKLKNKECDILPLAEETPKRKEYFAFTIPYITTPLVIATKTGIPFIDNISNIKSKPLGVVKNYSIKEKLENRYPGINLIEVDSVKDGLEKVKKGKIFGFLDNSIVINHEIHKNHFKDISINGQFQENFNLSIATRNDENILNGIMQKALLSIDHEQSKDIMDKWINVTYQIRTDYKLIIQIVILAILFIAVFIYWNLRLKEEIKKKKQAQKELKESEEKFRTLFDVAPILMDAFDKDRKMILWNKECEKTFGWKLEELKDHDNPISLFYPDKEEQKRVFESMRESGRYEEWHPHTKEGKKIVTMWANIKMPNNETINIGYDITAQRRHEEELKNKTQELKCAKEELEKLNNSLEKRVKQEIEKNLKQQMILLQQNRLVQMGEMIENIAHQWRQPLSQINSCILIIDAVHKQQEKNTDPVILSKLNEIEEMTSYMSSTIDDFKNFFNPSKQKDIFKVKEAVLGAYSILKGALKANYIDLQIDADDKIEINSYIKELEHVLVVILNNAKDALIANNNENPKIMIEAKEDKESVILQICDNGKGIRAEHMEKIFEPYFTTKHKTQGTGLGLYMAKMIIEEGLKGHLNVYNKQNGACFEIYLPKESENE